MPATGTTSNLEQLLKSMFCGTEVCTEKSHIGIHHTNQCQVREMVSLGQNLGSDNNIYFTRFHFTNDAFQALP